MAFTSDSGNEQIANDKLNDFTTSDDEIFFFDQKDNKENENLQLTNNLKHLKISNNIPEHIVYPYNDPYNLANTTQTPPMTMPTPELLP